MSSFALLPIFSGFEFDLPKKQIGFSPVVSGNFKCLWSLGTGWGDFIKIEKEYKITIAAGYLELESIVLGDNPNVKAVYADGNKIPFTQKSGQISFGGIKTKKEFRLEISF